MGAEGSVLVLAPSSGFGGGIERVAHATLGCLGASGSRRDLYRAGAHARASGAPSVKLRFAAGVMHAAARERPAIVLALHVGLLPVAAAAAAACRARLAVLGIGHEVWRPLSRPTRALLARCGSPLAISAFTADVMALRGGLPRERIRVVPLSVDEAILLHAREPRHPAPAAPTLVTVSRMAREHRYKGHLAIAESLPGVLERRPDARWTVVGDGDDREAVRRRCEELGVAHAVRFTGRVSDEALAAIYREAAALVLPSVADSEGTPPTGEGFGLVYAEAGAFGVPSIASAAGGGAAEFVTDDITGLTVPPGDRAALAASMVRLLDDGALRARLGEAARRRVQERHRPEHFCAALRRGLGLNPRP